MKNEGTDYISLYGITIVGDHITDADTAMKENGWITYYTNENTSAYLTTINDRAFMASFEANEEGKVTFWYLNNWPQGDDIYEVLNGQTYAEDEESQETPAAVSEWKQAYIDYVNNHGQFEISKLVNINNDEIPELYINFGSTASGDVLCSYAGGTIIEQPMYNCGFSYIEGQNLFRDMGGIPYRMDSSSCFTAAITALKIIQMYKLMNRGCQFITIIGRKLRYFHRKNI